MQEGDIKNLRKRYQHVYPDVSEKDFDKLLIEYLAFMIIKSDERDYDGNIFSPSPKVKELWAMHVQDTRSYRKSFSNFIHFDPNGSDGKTNVDQAEKYARLYQHLGKESKERKDIWPEPLEKKQHDVCNEDGSLRFRIIAYHSGGDQAEELFRAANAIVNESKDVPEKSNSSFNLVAQVTLSQKRWTFRCYDSETARDLKSRLAYLLDQRTENISLTTFSYTLDDDDLLSTLRKDGFVYVTIKNKNK